MNLEEDNEYEPNWEHIQTITTFDGINQCDSIVSEQSCNKMDSDGSSHLSFQAEEGNTSTHMISNGLMEIITAKASTPVSLLVESLVQQLCVLLEPDTRKSSHLYTTICEKLHEMNLIDETYAMGEFELMRNQYQRALYQLVSVCREQELPSILQNVWPLSHIPNLDWSRFFREFDDIEYLAGGGFGKVYKARHKLDGIVYAVKKITIKSTNVSNVLVHLSEVKTLASLNHTNIVSYKAAWLEPLLASTNETESKPKNDVTIESESSYEESLSRKNDSSKVSYGDSSESIQFKSSSKTTNTEISGTGLNRNKKAICKYTKTSVIDVEEKKPHLKLKWATLFIQMTLCNKTLRQFLDERNKCKNFDNFYKTFVKENQTKIIKLKTSTVREQELDNAEVSYDHNTVVLNLFQQLVEGLDYIHRRNVVHHDIKPSNIFVTVEGEQKIILQLGDFGLACPLHSSHSGVGFGTPMYAAPEQLNGICDPKSDIYSLGIILLELFLGFSTDMERAETIKNVKKGVMSTDLDDKFSKLVKQLISHRISIRPDTRLLLQQISELRTQETNGECVKIVSKLKQKLSVKDQVIESLKNQIEAHNEKIEYIRTIDIELKTKNEELKIKEQEIEILKSKITKMEYTETELKSKDDEINRLKQVIMQFELNKNV